MIDAVVYGAAQLVVGPSHGDRNTEESIHGRAAPATGGKPPADPAEVLEIHENAAIAIEDGTVAAVGATGDIVREYPPENAATAIDASGRAVLPGFVDSHTHAIFAGDRSDEFAAKLRGKRYQEILAEGGGILRTVRATREASDEELLDRLLEHLDVMLEHGSTTAEVKSGYGLDTRTERRLLRLIDRADDRHPVRVVPTFMGAHAVPDGVDADEYASEVVDEQLPAIAEQGIAAFCDVFCEEGVFSVEQSRTILSAGLEYDMPAKIHAEEFVRLGGAQLAAELGAVSADHLLHASTADVRALRSAGVVPVLLPGTAFALGTDYADARAFRDAGVEIAIATDFNPNCHAPGMDFATTLACVGMGLSPAEAIRAGTHGGALALGSADPSIDAVTAGTGTLQPGAPGDLLVLDAPSYEHVPYRFGQNAIDAVLVGGEREGGGDR